MNRRDAKTRRETLWAYAVELTAKNGHVFLAYSSDWGPKLFQHRRQAVAYRKELDAAFLTGGRIVEVELTLRISASLRLKGAKS